MCPAHPIQSASSSPFPALCPGAALPLTLPSLITSKGHPCLDEQATLSSLQPIRARGGFLKQSLSRTPLCLKSAHSSACLVHKLLRVRLAPCPLLQPCPLLAMCTFDPCHTTLDAGTCGSGFSDYSLCLFSVANAFLC